MLELKIEKGHDKKGMYCICPTCKQKCYYFYCSEDSWACECLSCDELLDEVN